MTGLQAELEASVPSFTTLPNSTAPRTGSAQKHVRGIRVILEELDNLGHARESLVTRAKRRADVDDIQPNIVRAAAAVELWAEVHPSMFEDVLEEELSKFEMFRDDIKESGQRQEELLASLRVRGPRIEPECSSDQCSFVWTSS